MLIGGSASLTDSEVEANVSSSDMPPTIAGCPCIEWTLDFEAMPRGLDYCHPMTIPLVVHVQED